MANPTHDADYGEREHYARARSRHLRSRRWHDARDAALLITAIWSPLLAAASLYWYATDGAPVRLVMTALFTLATLVSLATLYRQGER